tara:strand:+ start:3075 stop:3536 length:462 start_codon:yes stop_codon:yes gene_type:complete
VNIFILDKCPIKSAQQSCDKHVVKMILESAQLLCSVYEKNTAPYKRTHYNHPCSIWVRESIDNFNWLITHAYALCEEYTKRYNKTHKSKAVIEWCENNKPNIPSIGLTKFAQAMPEEYKNKNVVKAYRDYYIGEKSHIATWKTQVPKWFKKAI